jgi:hypothetical protein
MTLRTYLFAGLVLASCGKSDKDTPPAAGNAPAPTAAAPTPATPPATPAAPAVADVSACSLLTAAEVSAIFGKTLVATGSGHSCTYGLDPVEKQKQMEELQKGGVKGVADMAKGGGFKMPTAISDQLAVELSLEQDDQTEEQIKATLASVGSAVNATKPAEHGLNDTVKTGKDIAGVGDWAFSINVASVNMGMGLSTRGRLLEARKGPWHITVSVTIAPDPGEAKLDDELAAVARGAIAKLK